MEQVEFMVGSSRTPIMLSLKEFHGKKLLDIRKYFKAKGEDGELKPTRKGISLTGQQLALVLEALSEHSADIEEFYNDAVDLNIDLNLDMNIDHTMGRLFQFTFENGKTSVLIDKVLSEKVGHNQSTLFVNLLLLFHSALLDALDNEDDVELILDSLNRGLGRSVC